ncbi:MAG: sialidase family protein [Bacteroidales bacterium]
MLSKHPCLLQELMGIKATGSCNYPFIRRAATCLCRGRVRGSGDFGDINIVLKRSNDHENLRSLTTVVNYDSLQAGNPAPVADYTDPAFPKGRIFLLFYNTGNKHEGEIRKGMVYAKSGIKLQLMEAKRGPMLLT